jgi:hypothetical protein
LRRCLAWWMPTELRRTLKRTWTASRFDARLRDLLICTATRPFIPVCAKGHFHELKFTYTQMYTQQMFLEELNKDSAELKDQTMQIKAYSKFSLREHLHSRSSNVSHARGLFRDGMQRQQQEDCAKQNSSPTYKSRSCSHGQDCRSKFVCARSVS